MVNLITGRPGHGKNVFSLYLLESKGFISYDKDSNTFTSHVERDVHFVDFNDIKVLESLSHVYDDSLFSDLPTKNTNLNNSQFSDGSIIVVDEAHCICPKSSNKDGFTSFIRFLKIHRHYGFDFFFITQSQKDLNVDVRNLVDNHYLVSRPFGVMTSFANHFDGCDTADNKAPTKISNKSFPLSQKYFDAYTSASINNYEKSIPKKYYFYILFVVSMFSFLVWLSYGLYSKFNDDSLISNSVFSENTFSSVVPVVSSTATSLVAASPVVSSGSPLIFYFHKFVYPDNVASFLDAFSVISPSVLATDSFVQCSCAEQDLFALTSLVSLLDVSRQLKLIFTITTLDNSDFSRYNLSYSFGGGSFNINNGLSLGSIFLFDYMRRDFASFSSFSSELLLSTGYPFKGSFNTIYPNILISNETTEFGSRVSSEQLNNTSVGFTFSLLASSVSDDSINISLTQNQSSLISPFDGDSVPVVSRRSISTNFDLTAGTTVPMFSLKTLLKSNSRDDNFPFLSFLFPDNADNSDSNHILFLTYEYQ